MHFELIKPDEIEKRSFEIIAELLGERHFDAGHRHVIMRCIHTSADFDYADNLYFSGGAVGKMKEALLSGCTIVTDTRMALAGINKSLCARLGVKTLCFIADEWVAAEAEKRGQTRSAVAVEKALSIDGSLIYAVGNAPTALIKLSEEIGRGFSPAGIIATPVGFVNVIQSKELITEAKIPLIVAKGRKGGSNIAAAICNALLMDTVNS